VFTGPDLDRLYVTTATENWSEEERRVEPAGGLAHCCRTEATGLVAAPFRLDPGRLREVTR
jgi:sugar lactone lactonase YvrE